jgi:putative ABC transport system substrate-binding protein
MRLFGKVIFTLLCLILSCLTACKEKTSTSEIKIGIIEPLEHKAMNEIVAGFSETIQKNYAKPVTIKVENAQNDANLQRAIIQKMRDQQYDLIIPIGTDTSQMTLSMIRDLPIISLASDLQNKDRHALLPCHLAIVHDEISSKQLFGFIHAVYPSLTQLTLIHSSANKVFPEVKTAIEEGKNLGITIEDRMVSSLPELYSTAKALPSNTQGIVILKDHLIVSGISTLAHVAADKQIPLISSDQGSVEDGAGFSLGVPEREIGVEGAKLAIDILNKKPICDLPIVEMRNLTVFINQKSLEQEKQGIENVKKAAEQFKYSISVDENMKRKE